MEGLAASLRLEQPSFAGSPPNPAAPANGAASGAAAPAPPPRLPSHPPPLVPVSPYLRHHCSASAASSLAAAGPWWRARGRPGLVAFNLCRSLPGWRGVHGGGAAGGADRGGKRRGRRGRDASGDDGVLRRLLAVRKGRDLLARALALTVPPQVPPHPPPLPSPPKTQPCPTHAHTQKCVCGVRRIFVSGKSSRKSSSNMRCLCAE